MRLKSADQRNEWRPRKWAVPCLGALAAFSLLGAEMRAQDVAEAARQEKARKAEQQKNPRHVYTEDDLKHAQILTPEDKAKVEARKKTAPVEQQAAAVANSEGQQAESLGEIARRLRKEKAERAAEARLNRQPSAYPLGLPGAGLAAPKPMLVNPSEKRDGSQGKLVRPSTSPAVAVGARPGFRVMEPHSSPAAKRISPFHPRPLPERKVEPVIPPARPSTENLRPVTVQNGDSLWSLARRHLGRGARWTELLEVNPGLANAPDVLATGSVVLVPVETRPRAGPGGPVGLSVVVQKGDTLWSIAHAQFGRGTAWTCIARANPELAEFTHMRIGMQLRMPSACPAHP